MTTIASEQLHTLAPIGLEELVERAALLARVDRKYVLPVATARQVIALAPATTRVLEIDGRRSFGYRSTYLDTPSLDSFLTAGRGQRRRWKVRTRSYLDTGGSWLEVKTRAPRDHNLKQRIEHPDAELVGGLTAAGEEYVGSIIGAGLAAQLRPVLATGYLRSTLLLPESDSRVTIDVDLGWTALPHGRDLDRPGLAIVETKTGSTPSAVDRLLWRLGHRPSRISKYGVGMAALHPSLPRLKWHHTLDRQLSVPRAA
ncbi:polyphosphate polymerase domain-containing protein [Nocardioides caeni]|uniref:Polyphosphate polymerase domain-containing protein n=1 Tax=Nocardioides caeni TaxID=574700 RepID=A0A4S8NST1_9ACTN|nr:polyphosphate polymerase domain-containing protein [Nocardioides caeni]THV18294.1 polyphosphate polymerase domain-containing protein [Nocardioides caeni]